MHRKAGHRCLRVPESGKTRRRPAATGRLTPRASTFSLSRIISSSALELTPAAGSFFRPGDDERQQSEWPVILRKGFFKEHFGGDPSIIGRHATLNGIPIVVIGVAPDGFNGVVQSMAPDVWLPLAAQSAGRFGTWFDSMGPGFNVSLDRSWLNQPTVFWLRGRWRACLARIMLRPRRIGPLQ